MPTVHDPEQYDVDQFIADRMAGKPWQPVSTYEREYVAPREYEPDPKECPNCDMTGRFVLNDYLCVRCRDDLERG
jgi:hypothetical protein